MENTPSKTSSRTWNNRPYQVFARTTGPVEVNGQVIDRGSVIETEYIVFAADSPRALKEAKRDWIERKGFGGVAARAILAATAFRVSPL